MYRLLEGRRQKNSSLRSRYHTVAQACAASPRAAMPFVSSHGGEYRVHIDGPKKQSNTILAYVVIGLAVVLSLVALVRLGSAASAAVASVSGATRAPSTSGVSLRRPLLDNSTS